jgi:hypothetical protein
MSQRLGISLRPHWNASSRTGMRMLVPPPLHPSCSAPLHPLHSRPIAPALVPCRLQFYTFINATHSHRDFGSPREDPRASSAHGARWPLHAIVGLEPASAADSGRLRSKPFLTPSADGKVSAPLHASGNSNDGWWLGLLVEPVPAAAAAGGSSSLLQHAPRVDARALPAHLGDAASSAPMAAVASIVSELDPNQAAPCVLSMRLPSAKLAGTARAGDASAGPAGGSRLLLELEVMLVRARLYAVSITPTPVWEHAQACAGLPAPGNKPRRENVADAAPSMLARGAIPAWAAAERGRGVR